MRFFIGTVLASLFCSKFAMAAQGQCNNGLCVMFEVSVELESHQGPAAAVHKAETAYINGTANSYSTRVFTAGDRCTKQVLVEQSYFRAMKAVMDSIISTDGETEATLTPAQQTMLIFYSTMMQQTLGFQCTARDLSIDTPDRQPAGSDHVHHEEGSQGGGTLIGIILGSGNYPGGVIVQEGDEALNLEIGDFLANGAKIVKIEDSDRIVVEDQGKLVTIMIGARYN